MFDGDKVEAIAPSQLSPMDFSGNCLRKCCDTNAPTHVTGPSRKLSNIPYLRPTMVFPILVGTSGNVATGTHLKPAKDLRDGLENLNNCSLRSELARTVESIM